MRKLLLIAAIVGVALAGCDDDSKKDEPTTPTNPTTTPVITIGTHPAATTNVTAGSITGSLTVAATVTPSATLSYQWYSNTSASNVGGTSLGTSATGAQTNSLTIPTGLAAGNHYYFCAVSATGAEAKRSNAATVTVAAAGGGGSIDTKLVGEWEYMTSTSPSSTNYCSFNNNGTFISSVMGGFVSYGLSGNYSVSNGWITLTNVVARAGSGAIVEDWLKTYRVEYRFEKHPDGKHDYLNMCSLMYDAKPELPLDFGWARWIKK